MWYFQFFLLKVQDLVTWTVDRVFMTIEYLSAVTETEKKGREK